MQSWRWVQPGSLQVLNVFLVVLPATILFAWVFFWFCEKPFMTRRDSTKSSEPTKWEAKVEREPIFIQTSEPHVSIVPD
jgi:peptidoglycan/LPS O-acetylase OafA/YrhL